MTEERKILEMLQAGQINIDEALGLLEAIRSLDTSDKKTNGFFNANRGKSASVRDSISSFLRELL